MPDSFCSFWTPKPFQAMVEVGRWVWWVWLSTPTAPAKPHSTRPCPHLLLNLGAGRGWVRLTKLVISRGSELILVCPGISVCPGLAELDIVRVTPPPRLPTEKFQLGHCPTQTLSGLPPPHTHTHPQKYLNSDIVQLKHCPTWTLSGLHPPPCHFPQKNFNWDICRLLQIKLTRCDAPRTRDAASATSPRDGDRATEGCVVRERAGDADGASRVRRVRGGPARGSAGSPEVRPGGSETETLLPPEEDAPPQRKRSVRHVPTGFAQMFLPCTHEIVFFVETR